VKKIVFILVSLLIFTTSFTFVDSEVDTNSKFKAVFIYNFTKYIEWPKAYREGYFTIGVVNDESLYKELNKMAKTKKVANQSIRILKFNSVDDLKKCHILYLGKDNSDELSVMTKKMKSSCTLFITEKEGLIDKDSGINFIVKNSRLKFELNTKNIKKNKLKVSSNLEVLATSVK